MKTELHSIIVPVYFSKDSLEVLVKRVQKAMDDANIRFELLLIDDGSEDGSFDEIRRLGNIYTFVRGFRFSRNFGHQAALTVGLEKSRGKFVALIDDDLQDPPEILPSFFRRLYKDGDVVYGIRRKRKENIVKRNLYAGFYRILKILSKIEIPLDAGDFCVMKRCVVNAMLQVREANPFLRGIRSWVGFKQVGIEYERGERLQGDSGYTLKKYFDLAIAGMLSFSYIPLRLATFLGILSAFIGFAFAGYIVLLWFIEPFEVPGYASLIVVISFLGGIQLITIGIIGEYLARLSDNTRNWPVAIVMETTDEEIS
ncbi:glycosyltransferase [candidate division KSB1 bacterium]|nr:glycosyltransferase [candidate division KSB1 bacterium]